MITQTDESSFIFYHISDNIVLVHEPKFMYHVEIKLQDQFLKLSLETIFRWHIRINIIDKFEQCLVAISDLR